MKEMELILVDGTYEVIVVLTPDDSVKDLLSARLMDFGVDPSDKYYGIDTYEFEAKKSGLFLEISKTVGECGLEDGDVIECHPRLWGE